MGCEDAARDDLMDKHYFGTPGPVREAKAQSMRRLEIMVEALTGRVLGDISYTNQQWQIDLLIEAIEKAKEQPQ